MGTVALSTSTTERYDIDNREVKRTAFDIAQDILESTAEEGRNDAETVIVIAQDYMQIPHQFLPVWIAAEMTSYFNTPITLCDEYHWRKGEECLPNDPDALKPENFVDMFLYEDKDTGKKLKTPVSRLDINFFSGYAAAAHGYSYVPAGIDTIRRSMELTETYDNLSTEFLAKQSENRDFVQIIQRHPENLINGNCEDIDSKAGVAKRALMMVQNAAAVQAQSKSPVIVVAPPAAYEDEPNIAEMFMAMGKEVVTIDLHYEDDVRHNAKAHEKMLERLSPEQRAKYFGHFDVTTEELTISRDNAQFAQDMQKMMTIQVGMPS